EVTRFFLLRSHYRSPLNYTDANLDDAKQSLTRLYTALASAPVATSALDWNEPQRKSVKAAMDDDLGTPEAIAELHQLANRVFQGDAQAARQLKALGSILGLLQRRADVVLQAGLSFKPELTAKLILGPEHIQQLIDRRAEARSRKDFKEADRIRQELLDNGVVLEDKGGATTWRRV